MINRPNKLSRNTKGMLMPVFLFGLIFFFAPLASASSEVSASAIITNDPFFTTDAGDVYNQWYLEKIQIPEAWNFSHGSNSVIVAIVDTGIRAKHVELNDGRVIAGYNALSDVEIPANTNSDDNGHGTAVAGIIGAISNNAKGLAGINWNVKLMPIKALTAEGNGEIATVAKGIIWAADHGANIINLSLGGTGFNSSKTLSSAIAYAYNKGVLIIAASGNDSEDRGLNLDSRPIYPVCGDNGLNMVLGVAATDVNDQRALFSNYGSQCIDISAPGQRILTSAFFPSNPTNNVLIYGSGTSVATAVVSGVAALIKSYNPDLSSVEIRNIIMETADDIDNRNSSGCNGNCSGLLGAGRINALNYFIPKPAENGSLLRDRQTGQIYLIQSRKKHLISEFVFKQRGFLNSNVIDSRNELDAFQNGPALLPLNHTLIKASDSPTVFLVEDESIHPLSLFAFESRNFRFNQIKSLSPVEVSLYRPGNWLPPADGAMFQVAGTPQVYVIEKQVWRPISHFTFLNRGLSFRNIINIGLNEFDNLPKPSDKFWLPPLDGTLVKSDTLPAVYVIENGLKRVMSANAFKARKYSFDQIQVLDEDALKLIDNGKRILK